MLQDKTSSAIVAVKDLAGARGFYEDVLGLTLADQNVENVLEFTTGDTSLMIYQSAEAGTNRANTVEWGCGAELGAIIAALEARNDPFEHYPDSDGMRLEGNIYVAGEMKMVWNKDPDGNILRLNNM